MQIIVCIKQVPENKEVQIDSETGVLKRDGVSSIMNPYDLYALETALQLKEKHGGEVIVITMGPPQAEEVVREAYMMGADRAYILSDLKFAGADTLATSYTIANGIKSIGLASEYDLIVCGMESIDGDTAQVGPAIAENLKIPHVSYVMSVLNSYLDKIIVKKEMAETLEIVELRYPGLITVTKNVNQPRLPSFKLKLKTQNKNVKVITLNDLIDKNENHYGLKGSPTQVEKVFPPENEVEQILWKDNEEKQAALIYNKLKELKFV